MKIDMQKWYLFHNKNIAGIYKSQKDALKACDKLAKKVQGVLMVMREKP